MAWPSWAGLGLAIVVLVSVVWALQATRPGRATGEREAPDFRMSVYQRQDILGASDQFTLSHVLDQGKPVVLNFWAGLCPPCRAEMPGFQRVYDEVGERVVLLGVDIGPFTGLGSHDDARRLLRELEVTYPAAYGVDDPTRLYGVRGMPTTVFLTPDGRVFDQHTGFLTEGQLRSTVEDLVEASARQ